jgi:PAS domain S-box-containing protein
MKLAPLESWQLASITTTPVWVSRFTPSDESTVRRLQVTRLAVAGFAVVVLFGAWVLWRDPAPLALSALAAASAIHASIGVFRRPVSMSLALSMDIVAVFVAVAVLRPPAGAVIGLAVYAALAAVVFAPRRTGLWIALAASSGLAAVTGIAHLVAPRTWSAEGAAVIVALSVVVATVSVPWMLRIVADGLAEHERLGAALSESEGRHRTAARDLALVLDATAEGIYGVDAEGVCTFANKAVADILGYVPSDLVGRHMHDAVHARRPDGSPYPRDECSIARVDLRDGYSTDEEIFVAADGSLVPVSLDLRPIIGADGEVTGSVVSFRSIAEELEVRRQLHFQASLLGQVGNAVVATDPDGRVIYWNHHAEDMYGWAEFEAMGRPVADVVTTADADGSQIVQRVRDHGSWQGEVVVRRRDGSTFPAFETIVLLRDEDGSESGMVGVAVDVTERRKIEAHARRQGELARGILDSVHYPVCVVDTEGVILAVNRAWEVFGASNAGSFETAGVGASYLDATRSIIELEAVAASNGLVAVLEGRSTGFDLEYTEQGSNEERSFRMSVTPLTGIGAVVTHWDTTLERRARTTLEDLVASKDRFVAIVSHEFRTPLTVVLGLAEELRDGEFGADEVAEFHRIIADQARDLSHLVEDLLVIARADADSMGFLGSDVHVGEQVSAVLDPMSPDRVLRVEVDDASVDVMVIADAARLRQVLRNLIANALRHGLPPVRITSRRGIDWVAVEVVDQGPGVPGAIAGSLFEPYTKSALSEATTQSIGLGLFVSRELAQLMGGDLTYSRRGGTTVFTLTLPAAVAEGSASHAIDAVALP